MKFVAFVALALMAGAAQAQAPGAVDETKPVTRTEVNAKLDADYADLDGDKDGKVTAAEINARLLKSAETELAAIRKRRDESFAKLDATASRTSTASWTTAPPRRSSARRPWPISRSWTPTRTAR